MRLPILHSAFFALMGFLPSPLAVVHASPSLADSAHSCLLLDVEQWDFDRPRPAAKRLADLQVGEPRTVRMIYFLPNDRPYREEMVQKMKEEILHIQTWYGEQMEAHGHGPKTFRIETDSEDEPLVHRLDGQHAESYYFEDTASTVFAEIDGTFDIRKNIYFVVIDNGHSSINNTVQGQTTAGVAGVADSYGKNGGLVIVPEEFDLKTAAHELAHAFGLTWHDFRNNAYILSYGFSRDRLSSCHAEFLAVSPYFDPDIPVESGSPPTIELLSSLIFQLGSSKSASIRLKISDSDGLHQALLFNTTRGLLQGPASGLHEVRDCRVLDGETEAVVEFDFSHNLRFYFEHPLQVRVVDIHGDVSTTRFTLMVVSSQYVGSLEAHGGEVYSVAFAPSGALLASGSGDGTIRLWDVATETNTATLEGHADGVSSVAFSPDGAELVSGSWDGTVKLWDAAAETNTATLEGHADRVSSVAFSPDGAELVSGSWDGTVKLWDAAAETNTATLEGHADRVSSVAFSPDGAELVSGSWDGTVKLWDVATETNTATLEGHTDRVSSVAFSPRGAILASGSGDGTIRFWDPASGSDTATLRRHRAAAVAFSPGGAILASASWDGTVRLWDVVTGTYSRPSLREDGYAIYSAAFSPDGTTLATGSANHSIQLWDTSEWTSARPFGLEKISGDDQQAAPGTALADPYVVEVRDQYGLPLPGAVVTFVVTAGEGRLGGRSDGGTSTTDVHGRAEMTLTLGPTPGINTVEVSLSGLGPVTFDALGVGTIAPREGDYRTWHLPENAIMRLGKGRVSVGERAAVFSPDGQSLALVSTIGIWLYEVATFRPLALFPTAENRFGSVTFSPDGSLLASTPDDRRPETKLWNIATGEVIAAFGGHTASEAVFSPDGKILACGLWNGTVRLWDVATGQLKTSLEEEGGSDGIQAVAFSPDGTMLASGTGNGALGLWDVETGTRTATLVDLGGGIKSVAFSSDGATLASHSGGNTVKLWDVATGTETATLDPAGDVLASSPVGGLLATGGWADIIKVWDLATGNETAVLEAHTGPISSLAFSQDGTTLASVSRWDNTVKVWDLATESAATISGHTDNVATVAFSPDGTKLASGGGGSLGGYRDAINLWEPATGRHAAILNAHRTSIYFLRFLPGGTTLVSGTWGTVKMWDVATRENSSTLSGESAVMAVSPDGGTFAMERHDGTIDLLEVATGTNVATLEGHGHWAGSVAFSPDGAAIATATVDEGTVKQWDAATGTNTANLEGHGNGVYSVAFSPDGATLASAYSWQGSVRLWDLAAGTHSATLGGRHNDVVRSVRFSPDGTVLASGSDDQTVILWDVERKSWLATLAGGHVGWVQTVAFSPDGTTLASGSDDGTVVLWDVQFLKPYARTLEILTGLDQHGLPNATLEYPFMVQVKDQNGEGLPGAAVTFVVTAGSGTMSPATSTTDANGVVASWLTLGSQPGTHTVEATVSGLDESVTFTATARATADFDGDGEIGFSDFFLFSEAFGSSDPRFDLDASGTVDFADFFLFAEHFGQPARAKLVAMARELIGLPEGPQLAQNAPNPFNSGTVISWFQLQSGPARLEMFALTGQQVAVLQEGPVKAGLHSLRWDGRDDQGRPLASGIYVYRLVTPEAVQTRKLTLLR